ncbi:MAG: hypothetical protein RKO25_03915 [Candidatus Contendobacter sp.]|nr:hypothetical protein [Candidatus Contendobacter sp.]
METYQIQEYNQTATALSLLRAKYNGPFITTTKEGMAAAKAARAEVRGYRTTVEKLRTKLKAPLIERGALIDTEAKRINAELIAIEEPIDAAIKAEERRKEEEKAAKARAEAERIAQINARLLGIRRIPTSLLGKPATEIKAEIARLTTHQPDPTEFAEHLPEAIAATIEVRAVLEKMYIERQRADEEKARIEEEREELARLRALAATQQQPQTTPEPKRPKRGVARAMEIAEKPDPLAELIRALKAGETTIDGAMKDAYALGYEAGKAEAITAK